VGSQETGTSFHATKDQRFDYGRTLKNKSISYKSLSGALNFWCSADTIRRWVTSREGFSLYTERVIPLLTQEQKHKHLKFAKHYLNNWGLGAGKFILFHYDEKWFWGLLLRKTAKTFEEFEEKMKKRAMHTKRYGHIIKTISPKRWELRLLVLHSLTLWRMAETELSYILLVRRQLFFIRKERRIAC